MDEGMNEIIANDQNLIKATLLTDIVIDERARNGKWCCSPYPDHPRGCPNFRAGSCQCVNVVFNFEDIRGKRRWFAIVEEFNLKAHAEKMKLKHPDWSERQCRNLLYWQGSVRKRLKEKIEKFDPNIHEWGHTYLLLPEAHGVEVFETMRRVGIIIERNPEIVRKVAFVGLPL